MASSRHDTLPPWVSVLSHPLQATLRDRLRPERRWITLDFFLRRSILTYLDWHSLVAFHRTCRLMRERAVPRRFLYRVSSVHQRVMPAHDEYNSVGELYLDSHKTWTPAFRNCVLLLLRAPARLTLRLDNYAADFNDIRDAVFSVAPRLRGLHISICVGYSSAYANELVDHATAVHSGVHGPQQYGPRTRVLITTYLDPDYVLPPLLEKLTCYALPICQEEQLHRGDRAITEARSRDSRALSAILEETSHVLPSGVRHAFNGTYLSCDVLLGTEPPCPNVMELRAGSGMLRSSAFPKLRRLTMGSNVSWTGLWPHVVELTVWKKVEYLTDVYMTLFPSLQNLSIMKGEQQQQLPEWIRTHFIESDQRMPLDERMFRRRASADGLGAPSADIPIQLPSRDELLRLLPDRAPQGYSLASGFTYSLLNRDQNPSIRVAIWNELHTERRWCSLVKDIWKLVALYLSRRQLAILFRVRRNISSYLSYEQCLSVFQPWRVQLRDGSVLAESVVFSGTHREFHLPEPTVFPRVHTVRGSSHDLSQMAHWILQLPNLREVYVTWTCDGEAVPDFPNHIAVHVSAESSGRIEVRKNWHSFDGEYPDGDAANLRRFCCRRFLPREFRAPALMCLELCGGYVRVSAVNFPVLETLIVHGGCMLELDGPFRMLRYMRWEKGYVCVSTVTRETLPA